MGQLENRFGGDSYIFFARQKARGTHVTGSDVFDGKPPTDSEAKMIGRAFPFTRNTLDPDSTTAESESVQGANTAAPSRIIGRSAAGTWEFELLPDDAIHLLLGWFNPENLPTNTDLPDQTIPDGAIGSIPGSGTTRRVKIDNNVANAIAKWPGKLAITATGAAGNGSIRINGEQRRSRSNNFNAQAFETIAVNGETETSSTKFFHKIHTLDISGFTTFPTALVLKFKPDTKKTELTLHPRSAIFDGWSTQMVKATTPFTGYDVTPNEVRINVNQGSMRILAELLASYVQEGRTLLDPIQQAYALENIETILGNYPINGVDFFPSFGTALFFGNEGETLEALKTRMTSENPPEPVLINALETILSHNYTESEGFTGDPVGGPPVSDPNQTRTINVNATLLHQTDTSADDNQTIFWQDRYFEETYIPIIVQNYNWYGLGRQALIETEFPRCKLIEVPGLTIEGAGQPNRRLAFEAFRSVGATTPDEITMRFHSKEGFKE